MFEMRFFFFYKNIETIMQLVPNKNLIFPLSCLVYSETVITQNQMSMWNDYLCNQMLNCDIQGG